MLLTCCGGLRAQVTGDNGATFYPLPNDSLVESWCLYDRYVVGNVVVEFPAVGVDVHFQLLPGIGSGGHTHEGAPGGVLRPPAKFRQYFAGYGSINYEQNRSYATVKTLVNGCAYLNVDLQGQSGQYDIEGFAQGYGQGIIHNFASITGLVAYPDTQIVNTPLESDPGHADGKYYFNSAVKNRLMDASVRYSTYTSASARVDLVRGSLKYGADADNDYLFGIRWNPAFLEEHYLGLEVDVRNPGIPLVLALESAMLTQGKCTYGKMKPLSFDPATSEWWRQQAILHFVCNPSPFRLTR